MQAAGRIITCLTGVARIVLGGWPASRFFRTRTVQGLSDLSTWLSANAGAAILLLAYPPDSQPVRAVRPGRGTRHPRRAARPASLASSLTENSYENLGFRRHGRFERTLTVSAKPRRMPVMPRVAADTAWMSGGAGRPKEPEPFVPVELTSPRPPQRASAA